MLVAIPTFLSTPKAKSELYEEPVPDSVDGWETVYENNKIPLQIEGDLPDLSVYKIKRKMVWPHHYRIKYWIYNTEQFVGTFTDEVWLSDSSNNPKKWFIDDYPHRNENMWKGINGPYYTRVFPSPGTGFYYISVYLDVYDQVTESDEDNNEGHRWAWFW